MTTLGRRNFLLAGAALALSPRAALASHDVTEPLYQARAIVTGQREETRIPGLKLCLRDVLVRVSGDPRLAARPEVDAFIEKPMEAVTGYSYRDLYAQRPIRDEQGTRDRPYEMTVDYDKAKVDAMLAQLGSKPWLATRPRLVTFLAVQHIGSAFVFSADLSAASLMRESFEVASTKLGMPIVFPSMRKLEAERLTFESLPRTPVATLDRFAAEHGGDKVLDGTLKWNREKLGWTAGWRIAHEGRDYEWGVDGVNFDAAFRVALGGAAQILSGNGAPA